MSNEEYLMGDTVRLKAVIKDYDGDLATPAAITVSVINDSGTAVLSSVAANLLSTGTYYYDWTISGVTERCALIVEWIYDDSSKTHRDTMRMTVVPTYGG